MSTDLAQSLEGSGIRWVRLIWCDNANVIRAKAVHTKKILGEYVKHGVGIGMAQQAIPVMADAIVAESGLSAVGEVRLVPEWSTLAPLPYAPGHAKVMCDMVKDGTPWSLCPRHFLRRMIAEAKKEGIEIQAAFENEFYLFKSGPDGMMPSDQTVFGSTLAMDLNRGVIDEIAEALLSQKIPVEQYYPEAGSGQHEITVRYTHALAAADRQITFRETVRAVAIRHGQRASFVPKVFADQAGSGCHLHLSLWQGNQNVTSDANGQLTARTKSFIAGILHHLVALMAFTTPTPNSYRRIKPKTFCGAFRCWGIDNREAAVRVPSSPEGGPTNFELKTCDATANPFLALGVVIAAGLDGIRQKMNPPDPITVDPATLSDADRKAKGAWPLPGNLTGALNQFSADTVLISALGGELAQAYLAVRHAEWQAFKGMDLADEVKLLMERY